MENLMLRPITMDDFPSILKWRKDVEFCVANGWGVKAVQALLTYAKEQLNIRCLYAETHATNTRAQKMLTKLSFQQVSQNGTDMYRGEQTSLLQYELVL
ncbi:GNAT family N-acetyltransferase [Priestia koreensis]|uniref:GNAT family N-acetyltransferase n=1 Tax=Priestia koreensis TaxID=284581 RepID=UPI00345AA47E